MWNIRGCKEEFDGEGRQEFPKDQRSLLLNILMKNLKD